MTKVVIYSSGSCPFCDRAKHLLDQKGVDYQDIRIDLDAHKREEMIARTGMRTVPQIFINGKHVGGSDDLWALEQKGELDKLLQETV